MSFVWVNLTPIFPKYFHAFILFDVTASSYPIGKSFYDYVTGGSIQTGWPIDFDTFNPLLASDPWVSSPFKVLNGEGIPYPYRKGCL